MNFVGFLRLANFSLLLGLLFLPSSQSSISEEVFALKQIKKAIFEDPLSRLSDWNAEDADPCGWSGVACSSSRDHVISLDISNSSLEGFLAQEIGSLKFLEKLILRGNSLRGVIPTEIGFLKSLTVLDLSLNRLSGSIPLEIRSLERIVKINLRSNSLTGVLPLGLGNLSNLVELRLDRNKLQGSINGASGLCLSSGLKVADFSYNFLVGKVPSCLDYLPRTSFKGNCLEDESVPQRSSQQCANNQLDIATTETDSKYESNSKDAGQPRWLLVLEIFTGAVVLVFVITLLCTVIRKFKPKFMMMVPWKKPTKSRDKRVITVDGDMLKHVPAFSRQQLEIACEDFSNIIGSSTDIILYKGIMNGGPEIAAISLAASDNVWTTFYEIRFQMMVVDLARINHENIAKLLGYCKEENPFTRMLVFEYASNGTLYEYLHYGEGCQLFWTRRMKIAVGIARGLRHLHNELQPPFIVSDLNSSAICLTDDFSPKLAADMESWKSVLARQGKNAGFQKKADTLENVFAFGVILLEIISGRPPYCKDRGNLVNWAAEYLEKPDMMCHLVDPELRYFKHDDLRVVCNAVSLCIQSDPSKRPAMKEICRMLENGIDTSAAADLKESPLAWAELVLSS